MRVFVTSELFGARFNTLANADAECQRLADSAEMGGTFQAWLSDSNTYPSARFQTRAINRPYILAGSLTQIATGWDDIVDGTLLHAIDETENGNAPPPTRSCSTGGLEADTLVWTATREDGTHAVSNCAGWTNNTSEVSTDFAVTGSYAAANKSWSVGPTCIPNCGDRYALYCFEQ